MIIIVRQKFTIFNMTSLYKPKSNCKNTFLENSGIHIVCQHLYEIKCEEVEKKKKQKIIICKNMRNNFFFLNYLNTPV